MLLSAFISPPSARPLPCGITRLCGNTNDTASRPAPSIARLLALRVSALAEIVSAGVHHNRTSEHALRADELDHLVGDGALGVALAVGLEVAQVADVAVRVGWGAVLLVVGVDWYNQVSGRGMSEGEGKETYSEVPH